MLSGKEKCKALKEIRKKIAEENDIEYVVSECSHKGDCKGTCPRCEAELRYLEKELEKRQNIGKKVAIAGVSVGMAAAITGCTPAAAAEFMVSPVNFFLSEAGYGYGGYHGNNNLSGVTEELSGDMPYEDELDGEPIIIEPEDDDLDYEMDGDMDVVEPDETDCSAGDGACNIEDSDAEE